MSGFGSSPLGSSPLGLTVPDAAPVAATRAPLGYAVGPRLDPATRAIVLDRFGTPELADGVEMRVLIALTTDKGSSVIRELGNTLASIETITDNYAKRIDLGVRKALDAMVVSREIQILSVTPIRTGTSGIFARVLWKKTGEDSARVAFAGGVHATPVDNAPPLPFAFGAMKTPTTGGPTLVLGSHFTEDAVVYTDNAARPTTWLSEGKLLATLPAHTAGFVSLFVRQASGQSAPSQVLYVSGALPLPVASATTGVTDLGGTVTVTGLNFTADAVVWTDGAARVTTYVNATTLTAVVPAHTAGNVALFVSQASGNSVAINLSYTASAVDPTTFSPSGYWEQRGGGDVLDYSQTDTDGAGPDVAGRWEDRSGNSRHWAQGSGGAGTLPVTGAVINGCAPIVFDAVSGKNLYQASTLGDFGTVAEFVASLLVKLPAGLLPAWNANAFANPTLITDVSGWFSIMCGSEGGVNYVGVAGYSGGWVYARAPITTGVYQQVNVCHLGGQLMIEVNALPAIDAGAGIRKSVACGNIGQVVHALTSRNAGVGAAMSYEALSFFFRQTVASTRYAELRAWWRTKYASLTGVIPS